MSVIYEKCPYCQEEQEIEIEGLTEGDSHIIECNDCNEKFNFSFDYSIDSTSWKIGGSRYD